MKKKSTGTLFVPQFRTPEHTTIPHQSNSAIDDFIPSDCKVKTSSDAYYAIYCVIKAKKGGKQ